MPPLRCEAGRRPSLASRSAIRRQRRSSHPWQSSPASAPVGSRPAARSSPPAAAAADAAAAAPPSPRTAGRPVPGPSRRAGSAGAAAAAPDRARLSTAPSSPGGRPPAAGPAPRPTRPASPSTRRCRADRGLLGCVQHHQQRPVARRADLGDRRLVGPGGEPRQRPGQHRAQAAVRRPQVRAAQPEGRQRPGTGAATHREGRQLGGPPAARLADQNGQRHAGFLAGQAVRPLHPIGGQPRDPSRSRARRGQLTVRQPEHPAQVERRP